MSRCNGAGACAQVDITLNHATTTEAIAIKYVDWNPSHLINRIRVLLVSSLPDSFRYLVITRNDMA
jgi:hypothetical protein